MYKSVYKSVRWKRTAPVLHVVLRMRSEARTRQARQPAASRCVRRLNIAARNLGSFQIRGHNGVMSPFIPKGAILPQIRHNPRGLNPPTDRRLRARARFDV